MQFIHRSSNRAKNLTISITDKGEIVVTTPKKFPKRKIAPFVKEKEAWILKTLDKIKTKQKKINSKTNILVFGKKYKKNLELSQKKLDRFLKGTAEKYIIPRTHQLAKIMKTDFNRITLRQQKSRWGSCSNKGNLNFNWRLVHYPVKIIDYVIIHELAHITHPNHSKNFWNCVAKFDNEYRKHRGYLKRNGVILS